MFDPLSTSDSTNYGDIFSAPPPASTPDFNSSATNNPTAILSDQGSIGTFAAGAVALLGALAGYNAGAITATNNSAIATQNARLANQQFQVQGQLTSLAAQAQLAQAQKQANQSSGTMPGGGSLVMVLTVAGLVLAALQFEKSK